MTAQIAQAQPAGRYRGWKLLLLRGFVGRIRSGQDRRMIGSACARPAEIAGCGDRVEMPERQRKLDREREQRQPRAEFDVFPEPLHED